MSAQESRLALLTVVGKDKPGIIAKVTGILFRRCANLEDISMTVLEGELAMSLMVRLPSRQSATLRQELFRLEKPWRLSFFWKDLDSPGASPSLKPPRTRLKKYILSAVGPDQTGIVYRMSRVLARLHLNITDLNTRILTYTRNPVYALVLEFDIPRHFPMPRLERAFAKLRRALRLDISLKPVENLEL